MCAIAGLLAHSPHYLKHVRRMTALMSHRGPDDEGLMFAGPKGVWTSQAVAASSSPLRGGDFNGVISPDAFLALGHRRLSILDLSASGHQPMSYRDRYWIVYNGEVYNYLELRSELQSLGYLFQSQCDTEVILAAYAQWGVECFSRFNGMWALAVYDSQNCELVLSRDRFGIKPLYCWSQPDQFAFASEIKAFTALPNWRAKVNGQAIHDFLLSGLQDHSAETMFADVWQVEPGTFARLPGPLSNRRAPGADPEPGGSGISSDNQVRPEIGRWYKIRPRDFTGTFEEAGQRFYELLVDSVRLRLRADVPVGSCLSGGLDSSSIVCLTHQLLSKQQERCVHKTFSACSEIKRFDEREFIEHVLRATRAERHFVFPDVKGLFRELERVIWHQDEPFAGTSIYAQWCVFRSAAAADIKVMLDGQGADELLYGYHDFVRTLLAGLIRSGQWRGAWREAIACKGIWQGGLNSFARAVLDATIPTGTQTLFRKLRRNRRPPPWLNLQVLNGSYPGRLSAPLRRYRTPREMSLELLTRSHLPMLLHWEDRNSMAHSLESRVPFLDYRLVEFITGLPDHYKFQAGTTKQVLRQGMKDSVPVEVLQRRDKIGFVTPEQYWARELAGEAFRQEFERSVAATQGIIRAEAGRQLLEPLMAGHDYNPALWRVLFLGTWMRLFNVAL